MIKASSKAFSSISVMRREQALLSPCCRGICVICVALCTLECRARAGPGRAAAALARGCHTPPGLYSFSKDRAAKCRLSVGSLVPVLVTLSGNIFGGFCISRLLVLDSTVENSEAA